MQGGVRGKWIITVADEDDKGVGLIAGSEEIFIAEGSGAYVEVIDMEQATLGDVE